VHNVIETPIFNIRIGETETVVSLAELLGHHAGGRDVILTNCRMHQRMAVHAHLVQLACLAKRRHRSRVLPVDSAGWVEALLSLTNGDATPWELVPESNSVPGYMQPPAPDLDETWNLKETPDSIDALNAAAAHHLKPKMIGKASLDHWAYSLISVQTQVNTTNWMYPSGGRTPPLGRIFVGLTPGSNWGLRFQRDVKAWENVYDDLVRIYRYKPDGTALLWTLPVAEMISLNDLDPLFIEVCRRIRLGGSSPITARSTTWHQKPSAIKGQAKLQMAGWLTGDIWTPLVKTKEEDLLSPAKIGPKGFTYDWLHEVIFKEGALACSALRHMPEDGVEPYLTAFGIARYQGKTFGVHQRSLRVPAHVAAIWTSQDPVAAQAKSDLGHLSSELVQMALKVRTKVLQPSLAEIKDQAKSKRNILNTHIYEVFEAEVDARYVERLFQQGDPKDICREWGQELLNLAERVLNDGLRTIPLPTWSRLKWIARAKNRFDRNRSKIQETLCPA